MSRVLLTILFCLAATVRLSAHEDEYAMIERITSGLSRADVPITALFTGSDILVFGAIERNRFFREGEDTPPDVVVAIQGPTTPLLVRRKEKVSHVWTNNTAVEVKSAPAYYAVAYSRPVDDMLSPFAQRLARITVDKSVYFGVTPFSSDNPELFRQAVIRIRRDQGLYQEFDTGVEMLSPSLFKANFKLPPNIVEGEYTTRVLLVRSGEVIDEQDTKLKVHKGQFGQHISDFSQANALLYGLLSVFIALFAGWSASEVFRRLRH